MTSTSKSPFWFVFLTRKGQRPKFVIDYATERDAAAYCEYMKQQHPSRNYIIRNLDVIVREE